MIADWNMLSEDAQLAVSRAALHRAAQAIARQAETLATEMETGHLADRGGADALRLFAAVVRGQVRDSQPQAGHA